MIKEAVLVFALCVLSLSVAQDCPLPTNADIVNSLNTLLSNLDGSQTFSPTVGSVQYVCLAQGDTFNTYKSASLIATYTPNLLFSQITSIFQMQCNSGTWNGDTDGELPPPPPSVIGTPVRTDCYHCSHSFGDDRCRGMSINNYC